MIDHTYRGTPVSQMSLADVNNCLDKGFEVLDSDGRAIDDAYNSVRMRLEIELVRRRLGLAIRVPA